VIAIFVHRNGVTRPAERIDPAWLEPASGVTMWVDLAAPTADEFSILSDPFRFHPLAVEDSIAEVPQPKIEPYDGYLYIILHGIDFEASQHHFATHDTDFFLGPNYLVTIHDGQTRTIGNMRGVCSRNDHVLGEGPVSLMHRIVDAMVDHYRPEVEKLENKLDELEDAVFERPRKRLARDILALKRDISSLRRVVQPQRDVVARLARREFSFISDEMAYRFRDVYDHLVRLSEEALIFQDRVTGILDAHLSSVSNKLNEQMKVLTLVTTIAIPFTVLGGLFGMNVHLPGIADTGQPPDSMAFWYILAGAMLLLAVLVIILKRFKLL
jgi:magnesium transporter